MHLVAESHVDRPIDGPSASIKNNIMGMYTFLEVARHYAAPLPGDSRDVFRFHHYSTDEVSGDLVGVEALFTEDTPYQSSSPYSASKAPNIWATSRDPEFFNNYGPYHFPEELKPLKILNAIEGKPIPVHGRGDQIRDWL